MPNNKMAQAMVSNSQREKEYQAYLKQTRKMKQMSRPQWYKFNYGVDLPKPLKRGYGLPSQRAERMDEALRRSGATEKEIKMLRGGGD
ncbi:MAG: hypothetical protein MUP81_03170 [Dehalococcoidia bacterium]|nr:hypothetical protein [Dehalococcoidia bacterium]